LYRSSTSIPAAATPVLTRGCSIPVVSRTRWRARTPASWWWPWPSLGVPENTDTMIWVETAAPPRARPAASESRGQKPQGLIDRLRVPKSYARAKNWRAPSIRRAASSSSERMTPSSGPSSGPDQVLPPFAPGERQVRHLSTEPPGEQGDQIRVFVVGVGPDHQDALVGAELLQGAGQPPRRHRYRAGRTVPAAEPAAPMTKARLAGACAALRRKINDATLHHEAHTLELGDVP